MGATLIQDGRPVVFASRAPTEAESRYANIEHEMLTVIYGCERFHHFLFGQEVIVESDHKPLESIHLKHLHSAPARLRRMLLRLQLYDIVIRSPGPDVSVADALSWLPSKVAACLPDMDVQIHYIHPQFTGDVWTCSLDENMYKQKEGREERRGSCNVALSSVSVPACVRVSCLPRTNVHSTTLPNRMCTRILFFVSKMVRKIRAFFLSTTETSQPQVQPTDD